MFVRTRDYEKAIKSVRIDFGKAIGCEKDKDAFICVKELPVLAVSKLKTEVDKGLDEALLVCYGNTIKSLVDRNLKICFQTIEIYNNLLNNLNDKG